ncbi:MAG: MFS transporter [Rhodobacteraceae bacterium]|nr:MAG: MFS transporter [Paracoccaceae bacterium]
MSGQRISQGEFIFMMAMLVSTVALAIDAMLPAMAQITAELSPEAPNRSQWIVTSFILGMGLGTFLAGPLSDSFGRKPVVIAGSGLYILGAFLTWRAETLDLAIAARILQGLGAAAPRIVALAIIRDLYSGREMARLMSFVMIIFTLIPAFAPTLGALLIAWGGWRAVFLMFIVFSLFATGWMMLRLTEPLPPAARRPLRLPALVQGTREVFSHASVRTAIAALTFTFAMLFSVLSLTQQAFDAQFGRADTFHLWFGLIALCAGTASFLNSVLVVRLGMRYLVTLSLIVQVGLSSLALGLFLLPLSTEAHFALFILWQISVFFQAGMCIGNLNALAMEPLGHIAGLGASVISAVATVLSVILAVPVGLAFDGTPLPMVAGVVVFAACASLLMLHLRRIETRAALEA